MNGAACTNPLFADAGSIAFPMPSRLRGSAQPARSRFSTIADNTMRIDRDYTLETLGRLVRINSINPTLVPGAPGEKEIADRKSTRLNSSHLGISYAVFSLQH